MSDQQSDAIFWARLAEMPYVEAEHELRARRRWALARRLEAQRDGRGDDVNSMDLLITRLNDEVHRICEAQNRANLKRAMREVLDPETYALVMIRLIAMDPRAT